MLCLLSTVLLFAVLLKLYFKLRLNHHRCYTCLVGKTALITGANAGLGYMTALDFAQRGAKVVLGCRDKEKADQTVARIKRQTGNEDVSYKIFDAASFKSVREFAKEVNATVDRIDILVNNVGGSGYKDERTEDGQLMIMQVNHLAAFLLTHLLLDKLKRSKSARIVNIASWAGNFARFKVDDLEVYPNLGNITLSDGLTYANSKLCNILFTIELAKKLQGTNITANCLHPGTVNTDFFRKFPVYFRAPARIAGPLYFRNVDEGIRTPIYVSLSTDLEGVSGKFFDNCREKEFYESAKNPEVAKELWLKSEQLTKLAEHERIR